MKKAFFVVVFALLSVEVTILAGEWVYIFLREEWVSTSEGAYKCRMWYRGRNNGAEVVSEERDRYGYSSLDKLSNGQLECVNRMLNFYQNNTGDTYKIYVEWQWRGSWRTISVVLEFTSNTRYNYWAFLYN